MIALSIPGYSRGHHTPDACAYASALVASRIPTDIAVMYDSSLTTVAAVMDWWTAQLSKSEGQPITWHRVTSLSDCMLAMRLIPAQQIRNYDTDPEADPRTGGIAYSPGARRYDGIATVTSDHAWLIAHEIGHMLGSVHSEQGIMRPYHHIDEDEPLEISQAELAAARIVRIHARLEIMAAASR